jgi:hypothetical protein
VFLTVVILILLALCCTVVGRALLALCGVPDTSGLGPACGFALLMCVSAGVIHLPGRAVTALVCDLVLIAIAALVLRRRRAGLLFDGAVSMGAAGALVAAAMCIPFAVNGRFGLIGQSVGDDLGSHYAIVASLQQGFALHDPSRSTGYPIGPHSLVAAVSTAIGDINQAFTAVMILIPVLTACVAVAVLRDQPPVRRVLAASLVGLPYLTAAFYAQNAFKEMGDGLFVVAIAAGLLQVTRSRVARHAIVTGVLTAGAVQVTGFPAIGWALGGAAVWVVLVLVADRRLPSVAGARSLLPAVGWATVGLVVPLLLSAGRVVSFNPVEAATAGNPNFLGYYFHDISAFEALGVWPIGDFRYFPTITNMFYIGILVGGVALVFLVCLGWWLRERALLAVPATVIAAGLIYGYARHTQGAYVNAKPLAAMAPLVMLTLLVPLLTWARAYPVLTLEGAGLRALALVFVALAAYCTLDVLNDARVGPLQREADLMQLRPFVKGQSTLFLPEDHYVNWELAGADLSYPTIWSIPSAVPVAPRKVVVGAPADFDSVDPATLDRFAYVVAARTATQSEPPPNFRLVRTTRWYALYRRTGPTPLRGEFEQAAQPGATLECRSPTGAQIVRSGGVAAVRQMPSYGPGWSVAPPGTPSIIAGAGGSYSQSLVLPAGRQELSLQYQSQVPLTLSLSTGQHFSLPAYLGAYGAFWRVGDVTGSGRPVTVTVKLGRAPIEIAGRTGILGLVAAASPEAHDQVVPVRRACGRYVDWYLPG